MVTVNDFSDLPTIRKAVRAIGRGEQHNVGTFTLTPGATSTVVNSVNCAPGKSVNFSPATANAAAAMSSTFVRLTDVGAGSFTVTHASNAQADRTFYYEVTGGG